jgi:drug/metabolite transporter (DMT)-like permease
VNLTSEKTISTALGFASILLWSTTVAFGRSLSEQVGTLTTASLIYLLGGGIGFAYQAATGQLRVLRDLGPRYLYGCGSLFVVYIACLYTALGLADSRSQVLEVGLINYLWPTLTVLLSVPILKLKASIAVIPGAFIATSGVILATTQSQPLLWTSLLADARRFVGVRNSVPYILGALAALSWALYSTLSRRWAGGAAGNAVALFMLATGLVLGVVRLFVPEDTHCTARAAAELLYMVVGSNAAYVFWERAMRKGDIVLVASSSYLTPLLSTIVSILYLGAQAGVRLWIGCALVIVGAITCRLAVHEP